MADCLVASIAPVADSADGVLVLVGCGVWSADLCGEERGWAGCECGGEG